MPFRIVVQLGETHCGNGSGGSHKFDSCLFDYQKIRRCLYGKPKHWEYEERELTQDEYSQYLIAMEQAKEINEHSDEEAIDNYTRQLMDEGVL